MSIRHPGIYGNDTASSLYSEYVAVFSRNEPVLAVAKLDRYVRNEFHPEDWPDYVFSLAEFMWGRGILTDEIRDRAVALVDSGAGLLLWEEAGPALFQERRQELSAFRRRISGPQPRCKRVRVQMQTKPLFCSGDVIALQLRTARQPYEFSPAVYPSGIDEKQFRSYDGKWIAIRKVEDHIGYASVVEPAVRDIWPVFQLYGKIFDEKPCMADLKDVPWADTGRLCGPGECFDLDGEPLGLFWTQGRMANLRRRNYALIGNDGEGLIEALGEWQMDAFIRLGENESFINSDSLLLKALLPLDPDLVFDGYLEDDDEELPF